MAKVDCEANRQLCMEHMIRAYPTIQTYTHGDTEPAETYYGDRTVEAFNKCVQGAPQLAACMGLARFHRAPEH